MSESQWLRRYIKGTNSNVTANFDAIPQDRRDWKPDENILSATELLNHMTYWNYVMARILAGQSPIQEEEQAWISANSELANADQARKMYEESNAEFETAAKNLTPEQLDEKYEMPWGTEKGVQSLLGNLSHTNYHLGQLTNIQRLLGDLEDHL